MSTSERPTVDTAANTAAVAGAAVRVVAARVVARGAAAPGSPRVDVVSGNDSTVTARRIG